MALSLWLALLALLALLRSGSAVAVTDVDVDAPRRRLTPQHNNRRRIIRVMPENRLYVLDKEDRLKEVNASLPFAEYWYDDDEVLALSRDNATAYYKPGPPVTHTLDYLPTAVHQDPHSVLPNDQFTLALCPCGDSAVDGGAAAAGSAASASASASGLSSPKPPPAPPAPAAHKQPPYRFTSVSRRLSRKLTNASAPSPDTLPPLRLLAEPPRVCLVRDAVSEHFYHSIVSRELPHALAYAFVSSAWRRLATSRLRPAQWTAPQLAEIAGCQFIVELTNGTTPTASAADGLNASDAAAHRAHNAHACPATCLPVPFLSLALDWFATAAYWDAGYAWTDAALDFPLTCTATWRQLLEREAFLASRSPLLAAATATGAAATFAVPTRRAAPHSRPRAYPAEYLLHVLYTRRVEECFEHARWPVLLPAPSLAALAASDFQRDRSPFSLLRPRAVYGLLNFIGTRGQYALLHAQLSILRDQAPGGGGAAYVAGWMATEDGYPCEEANRCAPTISGGHFRVFMPSTSIPETQQTAPGWACAQRRPLRALAHTLWLYAPRFVLLGDDDTFVSKTLLFHEKVRAYIDETLAQEAVVLGDVFLSNRDISRYGFIWGGAGYLFGARVLRALTSAQLRGYASHGAYASGPWRTQTTSVLYEALALSARNCPRAGPATCFHVQLPPTTNGSGYGSVAAGGAGLATLPVHEYVARFPDPFPLQTHGIVTPRTAHHTGRLVDVCLTLLSHRDTCYHSDHALTRCFTHGVDAALQHMSSRITTVGRRGLSFSMQFAGTSRCDPFVSLTCHRHFANVSDPVRPVRIPPESIRKFYPS
jgi:hypothetical protein